MTIKQLDSGKWQVNIQPGGRIGKRVKKVFKTKAEGLAWERHVRAKVQEVPDWQPSKKDVRYLSELCQIWYDRHGIGLSDGVQTLNRLKAVCAALGNPAAENFSADTFSMYRTARIESGISLNTANREHAYMRGVFSKLIELGIWKKEHPLKNLKQFKIQEREMSYLRLEQIQELLDSLAASSNVHVLLIARICLATGGRWDEVESLRMNQLQAKRVQFAETKSKKVRAIPIEAKMEKEIIAHHKLYGQGERIFSSAASAFRSAIERTSIKRVQGQLTHVLRHTFASHFMIGNGNILNLQRILGHSDLKMTLRYAHLAPDHLEEALKLNPLNKLSSNTVEPLLNLR